MNYTNVISVILPRLIINFEDMMYKELAVKYIEIKQRGNYPDDKRKLYRVSSYISFEGNPCISIEAGYMDPDFGFTMSNIYDNTAVGDSLFMCMDEAEDIMHAVMSVKKLSNF
jgi:hypothetical protein